MIKELSITLTILAVIYNISKRTHNNAEVALSTLIIGSNKRAESIFLELESAIKSTGYQIVRFINLIDGDKGFLLSKYIQHLGSIKDISDIIKNYNIK